MTVGQDIVYSGGVQQESCSGGDTDGGEANSAWENCLTFQREDGFDVGLIHLLKALIHTGRVTMPQVQEPMSILVFWVISFGNQQSVNLHPLFVMCSPIETSQL